MNASQNLRELLSILPLPGSPSQRRGPPDLVLTTGDNRPSRVKALHRRQRQERRRWQKLVAGHGLGHVHPMLDNACGATNVRQIPKREGEPG